MATIRRRRGVPRIYTSAVLAGARATVARAHRPYPCFACLVQSALVEAWEQARVLTKKGAKKIKKEAKQLRHKYRKRRHRQKYGESERGRARDQSRGRDAGTSRSGSDADPRGDLSSSLSRSPSPEPIATFFVGTFQVRAWLPASYDASAPRATHTCVCLVCCIDL